MQEQVFFDLHFFPFSKADVTIQNSPSTAMLDARREVFGSRENKVIVRKHAIRMSLLIMTG
jgi:hypothetical protein